MNEIRQLTETAWLENELREAEQKAFAPVYGLSRKQRRTKEGRAAVAKAEAAAVAAKREIIARNLEAAEKLAVQKFGEVAV